MPVRPAARVRAIASRQGGTIPDRRDHLFSIRSRSRSSRRVHTVLSGRAQSHELVGLSPESGRGPQSPVLPAAFTDVSMVRS